jgi:cytochrome b
MTTLSETAPPPPVQQRGRVKVWDLPLRLFHWSLVATIAVAFLSSEEESPLNQWHVLAGWIAGILIVFRLVWGFAGGEHSRFADFVRPSRIVPHIAALFQRRPEPTLGHNPLGGLSVLILLALTGGTVWAGAFGGEGAEDLHELFAWTLLAFVALHVAAVIAMSILERENLVRAMITGTKSAHANSQATDARRPGLFGIAATAVIVAASVYGILQYDRHAFTPRSAEAFEHEGGTSAPASREQEESESD